MISQEEFNTIFESIIEELRNKNKSKGKEYSRHNDRLHNFQMGSRMLGCQPYVYLWMLRSKHEVSLQDMVYDWVEGLTHSKEVWKEKITDSIMYLILLYTMLFDSDIEA